MGSTSSKFRKHLQAGDEVQALQLYRTNSELRKALDPNCSYGDSHQHETPLHLVARHGMQTLLGIFLFSKGGNPNKTNARKETCLHSVCMEANSQSIHVCKRRAECLNYVLKWRGAKLAEGQVEKIEIGAQDEKSNTALHYAAASGLAQCVETLIQHGAPLFIENEDNLTPCDTAERSGHAAIALYLESKMVFSNEEEPHGDDDDISMPPVEEYSGLRPQDLQEAKDQLLVETADMLSVPLFTAEALLRNHEWSRETLLEAWMTDPVACCEKCGVTPPSTLFSEKPQVQENLASPLPSPLHTAPTPLDAECNICANTFLIADEPVHMTCTHQFCKDCWERYLNIKIQEGDAHHITCPAYDCTMLVPVDIIEGIVSRDMALRYLQFDIKAFVDSNPDMKWCPFPGCGRAVKLPDLDLGTSQGNKRNKIPSDTSRGVDCGAGHYFCWECLEESHEPCSCDNWSKWFQKITEVKPENLDGTEQETELAANCLWLVTNSKPCPNCKSPIQKNEGCNHMKCSKCKFDFCWVCLEQWKRHNSSTGGYFKCNRYEVLKKVEEQSAQLVSEAETKNKSMQELNRFVHYYTRFKNHENSYKLEEPLLKTAKDKMMKLAEAVTDNATAHAETKFVEDAVQQLLKARRVLKCSYVYGFYLDGPGYKKIVFEFMQTELEECTEILSQMVNRLYLRTPRRKIIEQAHIVQRKRLEFIMAISKGLVPPETPPSARKGKKKRKMSVGGAEDEDLHRAIVASIQEVDPANPWIKDASGRHTNVVALLEWPSDESEESEGELEQRALRETIGKCRRVGCNKVRAKNPRTNEHHDYCSRWCMQVDHEEQTKDQEEGISEIVLDEHMELLRALEMSRLQYLRDSGLLHVPDTQSALTKSTQTRGHRHKHRPRSNSAGQETKGKSKNLGISSMEELGIELQRFQELSSAFPRGEREEAVGDSKKSSKLAAHRRKLSQSSRFDETKSTIVPRVPNKSVEDLYCLDQTPKSKLGHCYSQGPLGEMSASMSASIFDSPGATAALVSSGDALSASGISSSREKLTNVSPMGSSGAVASGGLSSASSLSASAKNFGLIGSMFGAIKDISVSNIHSSESDKTKDFLSKDLASIFAEWDSDDNRVVTSSPCDVQGSAVGGYARRPLTLEDGSPSSGKGASGKSSAGKSLIKNSKGKGKGGVSRDSSKESLKSSMLFGAGKREDGKSDEDRSGWAWSLGSQPAEGRGGEERLGSSSDKLQGSRGKEEDKDEGNRDSGEISLLEMAENLLQMTADVHSRMKEVEKGIRGLDLTSTPEDERGQKFGETSGSPKANNSTKGSDNTKAVDAKGDEDGWCESVSEGKATDHAVPRSEESSSCREKILFRLPKTAWSLDTNEDGSTKWSSGQSKSNKKTSSLQKTKVYDSEGARNKSSRKSSSKSKKSKGEPVAVALVCDADGRVHEIPTSQTFTIEKLSSSPKHDVDRNLSKTSNISSASSSAAGKQKNDMKSSDIGEAISCEDRSMTLSDKTTCVEIEKAQNSAKEMYAGHVHQDYSINSADKSNLAVGKSPSSSTATTTRYVEEDKTNDNVIEYSLTRNISPDNYDYSDSQGAFHHESTALGETGYRLDPADIKALLGDNSEDDNNNDNVVASSALITDAYETATSDDNWEDASSVLPSDIIQTKRKDQMRGDGGDDEVDDDDDDDDLDSVYV